MARSKLRKFKQAPRYEHKRSEGTREAGTHDQRALQVDNRRNGGTKVLRLYGREHFQEIGRKGGRRSPTRMRIGEERAIAFARKGGLASAAVKRAAK